MKTKLFITSFLSLLLASACGVDSIPQDGMGDGDGDGDGNGDGDGDGDGNGAGADAAPAVAADMRIGQPGLQVLYKFDGLAGDTIVKDISEVGDPYDLTIADPAAVVWEPDGGLTITTPTIISNTAPFTKAYDACRTSQEITIEAWVKNATVDSQGRVVTSALDSANHNFALKQNNTDWEFRLRTSENNLNGNDPADAPSVAGMATTNMQQVIWTRDDLGVGARFAFDGGLLQAGSTIEGNFTNWDATYGLAVGNEPSLDRPWLGTIYLLAIYCTEFDQSKVNANYAGSY
jgi:hypothetical protein